MAAYPPFLPADVAVVVTDAKVVPPPSHVALPRRNPFRQRLRPAGIPEVPHLGLEPFQARGGGLRVALGVQLEAQEFSVSWSVDAALRRVDP